MKYYQRSNPVSNKWDTGQSLVSKHIMHNKYEMEPHIHWKINSGSYSFYGIIGWGWDLLLSLEILVVGLTTPR